MPRFTPQFALLAALALAGCRDLAFPDGSGPVNPGPVVGFLAPSNGEVVPRSTLVRLSAEDVNGVGQVSLRCGGSLLRSWAVPPYEGQLNLASCVAEVTGDGGTSLVPLTLVAQATDKLGNVGDAGTVSVQVDLATVMVTAPLPERVLPGGTLAFEVTTNLPVQGLPQVFVEGEAAVVAAVAGSKTRFTASFAPTPGLGSDLAAPTAPVPMSLLEQLERPLVVSVSVLAENGNPTRLDQTVQLSRIIFSRPVPGGISSPAPDVNGTWVRAVGTVSGLALHVPKDSVGSQWVPGWMEAGSGALSMVADTAIEPGSGFAAKAFDGKGRALMHTDFWAGSAQDRLVNFGGQSYTGVAQLMGAADAGVLSALGLTGDALCLETVPAPLTAACPVQYQLACLEGDGGMTQVSVASGAGLLQVSTVMLRSGPIQLNFPPPLAASGFCCGGGAPGQPPTTCRVERGALIGPSNNLVFKDVLDGGTLGRALPVGDGTFALSYTVTSVVAGLSQDVTERFDSQGTRAERYFGDAGIPPADVVIATSAGAVVALRRPPPNTQTLVELWRPGAAVAQVSFSLPGYWSFVRGAVPQLPTNAIVDRATGRIAMLLKVGGATQGQYRVAVFDASLRPRWIYSYPAAIPDTAPPALMADEPGSALYLVDYSNQVVTALAW
jgi:hypothetical protein